MLATDISQKIVANQTHSVSALDGPNWPVRPEYRIEISATKPAIFGIKDKSAQAPACEPWKTSGA